MKRNIIPGFILLLDLKKREWDYIATKLSFICDLLDFQAISKHEAANHDIQFNISIKENSDKHQPLSIEEVSTSLNISTPARKDLPASGQLSSPQHKQNKQDVMDDFPNPVGENIANVLSFEDPFPQISSPDYRNIPVASKNMQRSYLSPEFRSTSVLKKQTNESTQRKSSKTFA